jgi:FtsP/CotA-like multicopper oxidase with cupredoxin domain/ssDNA-binding Zn-finger/Zn-ribbon topoisomerase 1
MTDLTSPASPEDTFTTETTGLAEASAPKVLRLRHGDRLDLNLSITPVAKRIGEDVVRMLAYNGSIPGPTLHVDQGSEISVEVSNHGDVEATVHWHGLRLENRYDGVPHETQAPIPIGGTFGYRLQFPDPGFYWYHPHVREDFGLEMGLYGTILVEPSDASYWPAADRHLAITIDDVLIEDGQIAAFRRSGPTFTAMGRFGNVMLTNGQTRFSGHAKVGEVIRLYLVNTANTRIFNLALPGARMKLVGGDSGRYERETFVEEVMLAPSERAVVDVLFDTPGDVRLEHRTPDHVYNLGAFWVAGSAAGDAARSFDMLRTDPELTAEHNSIAHDIEREPDKVLAFLSLMPLLYGGVDGPVSHYTCPMHPDTTGAEPGTCPKCGMQLQAVRTEVRTSYACPMHPEVIGAGPEACPKCGMKLVSVEAAASVPTSYACPMHPEVTGAGPETCPKCGMKLVQSAGLALQNSHHGAGGADGHDAGDGIEWEDLMPDINRLTDPTNMIWKLIDRQTGAENGAITWAFTVGDRVKIRLANEMDGSEHPMHHPFHVHGAGRFLVLSRQGVPEPNLVWKDTVLLPAGQTVDILLDVSNPGLWMAHCHIAEHAQSGMMFSFDVSRTSAT